jgi:hypothetical protein
MTLGPHWHAPGASSGRLRGNEPGLARPDLTSLTRGGIGTDPRPRLGVHSAALTRRGDGRSALMAPGCVHVQAVPLHNCPVHLCGARHRLTVSEAAGFKSACACRQRESQCRDVHIAQSRSPLHSDGDRRAGGNAPPQRFPPASESKRGSSEARSTSTSATRAVRHGVMRRIGYPTGTGRRVWRLPAS